MAGTGRCRWRRRGSRGRGLRRPGLGREIGGDLAKIILRQAFGDGCHDRVVAIAASVVVQLLDQIALLLAPDDRNGFWFDGYTVLTVTCVAHLHFCLDVVGRIGRCGNDGKTNPSAENRRYETCQHGCIPPSRDCARCPVNPSIQTKRAGRNPAPTRPARPNRPINIAPKPADRACSTIEAESRYLIRRLAIESVTIPRESSFKATKTNFH